MKTLVALILVSLSMASFAGKTSLSQEMSIYASEDSKPKRPPITDDGPIWPPVQLR